MLSKKQIKAWLLANCLASDGTLDLAELDFTNNPEVKRVCISYMKLNGDLWQDHQTVNRIHDADAISRGGNLFQGDSMVAGDISQSHQKCHNLAQSYQLATKTISQDHQTANFGINQSHQKTGSLILDQNDARDCLLLGGNTYLNKRHIQSGNVDEAITFAMSHPVPLTDFTGYDFTFKSSSNSSVASNEDDEMEL